MADDWMNKLHSASVASAEDAAIALVDITPPNDAQSFAENAKEYRGDKTMTDIDRPSEQIAENANCSIDKLAREVVLKAAENLYKATDPEYHDVESYHQYRRDISNGALGQSREIHAARLGILEGMKLQRERDAVIVEKHPIGGGTLSSWIDANESPMGATRRHIAAAIRRAL